MLAGGGIDVWWVGVSAFVTVLAGGLALALKRAVGWVLHRTRVGFLEWFGEAINAHVVPQVDEVRRILDERTPMFAELEMALQETQATLRDHMDHDDRIEEQRAELRREDGAALIAGQAALFAKIGAQHTEAMAAHGELTHKVDDHVLADAEAFARLEAKGQP